MRMRRALILILAFATAPSVMASEQVQLSAPAGVSVNYDPFNGMPGLEDVALEISYSGEDTRQTRLIITPEFLPDISLSGLSGPLEMEIESSSGIQTYGKFEMPLTLSGSNVEHVNLTFKIPPGQYADAGNSDLDMMIKIVDAVTGEPLLDDKPFSVSGDIPSRAQTNFAGASPGYENGISVAHVDFGKLTSGDSRQVNFQVRGNTHVTIELSSENLGKLVNLNDPAMSPVPYSIEADGVYGDLSAPLQINRVPEKSLVGSSYPLVITLDEFGQAPYAGEYRDIITIDVSPQ